MKATIAHQMGDRTDVARSRFGDELGRFVAASQVLAIAIARRSRSPREAAELLQAALPRWHSSAEFFLLRSVLVEFAVRTLQVTAPSRMASVMPLATLQPHGNLATAFLECLSAPLEAAPSAGSLSIQQVRSIRAVDVIAARCCDPAVTAGAVTHEVGVSEAYLAKLLRVHNGHGFRAALRQARINVARGLLEQTLSSVKELAVTVGYSSTSQFDRDFRRQCGLSPLEYRKRNFRTIGSYSERGVDSAFLRL